MAILTCEGIVMKSQPLFESDKLVTIFTREEGMLRVLVKRANGKRFRDKGLIEPLTHSKFTLNTGKTFLYYSSADLLNGNLDLRTSLAQLNLAFYCCDVVVKSTSTGQANPGLFDCLLNTLSTISQARDFVSVLAGFHQQFLTIEGISDPMKPTLNCDQFVRLFEQYSGQRLNLPRLEMC